MLTVTTAIDPVSSADMNPQLHHALTHRLRVAEVPGFDLSQSGGDSGLPYFVAQCRHPLCERGAPIVFLVIDELRSRTIVA